MRGVRVGVCYCCYPWPFFFFLCCVVDEFDETTTFIYDNLVDIERESESALKPRNGRAE